MKKRFACFVFLMALILLTAGFASAQVKVTNYSIKNDYFGGDYVSGTIVLNITNEPVNSVLTSNFLGNITLIDLLKNNGFVRGSDFTCTTDDCDKDYTAGSVITSLNVPVGENKLVGFKIPTQDFTQIDSVKFGIDSNSGKTCFPQAVINLLNKNESFLQNYKYTLVACTDKILGCFDSGLSSYLLPEIGSGRYCEKIKLAPAAAYEIGASLDNSQNSSDKINLEIFGLDGSSKGKCSPVNISSNGGDVKCLVEYINTGYSDSLICVSSESASSPNYKIRAETSGEKCGTIDINSQNYNVDYEIFAKVMQFDNMDININDSIFIRTNPQLNGQSLTNYLNNYLNDKYGSSCPDTGCLIPLKIISYGNAQTIGFKNIDIKYGSSIGSLSINSINLINEESSKIKSVSLTISLDKAKFSIPVDSNKKILEIFLNGNQLLTQKINVTPSFNFDITPKFALIGAETRFSIVYNENLNKSLWNFGDGVKTANGNNISYNFLKNGTFPVVVEITNKAGLKSRKSFDVLVGNANQSAKVLIDEYEIGITNASKVIGTYPSWIAEELKKNIGIEELNSTLTKIKNDYSIASDDSAYASIVERLLLMKVPISIYPAETGNLPLYTGYGSIDVNLISSLSGEENFNEEEIKKSIVGWTNENYDSSVDMKVIVMRDSSGNSLPLLTYIRITLRPKISQTDSAFLIINHPLASLKTTSGGFKEIGSGSYLPLTGNSQDIEIVLPGKFTLDELGAYVSPETKRLSYYSDIPFAEKGKFKTAGFFVLLGILFVLFLIVYIFLQEWYKRNYESSLFANLDDLYNLINFIYNSRQAGLSDGEIRSKLSKNWNGEKITYAFKKIDGKRTGMFEIPLFKLVENNKVKNEIMKRQNGRIDARFIKRP